MIASKLMNSLCEIQISLGDTVAVDGGETELFMMVKELFEDVLVSLSLAPTRLLWHNNLPSTGLIGQQAVLWPVLLSARGDCHGCRGIR